MITVEKKNSLIQEFKTHEGDTGSCEVQIALLTERIRLITEHLKNHRKDHTSRRGLLMLVNRRSNLLRYLKRSANDRYATLINRLGLRK